MVIISDESTSKGNPRDSRNSTFAFSIHGVGAVVGPAVWPAVGSAVGPIVGPAVGPEVGPEVGPDVGDSVSQTGVQGTS